MKKICFLILAALISTVSMAQTAKSVLDKAAANITVKEGVKANFRMTGGIGFTSGTILIKGNMEDLARYLKPKPAKLQKHGVSSVQSRVVNLSELNAGITAESLGPRLKDAFIEEYKETDSFNSQFSILNFDDLIGRSEVRALYEEFASDEWRFGRWRTFTAQHSAQFDWGGVELQLTVDQEHGVVTDVQISSDALDLAALDEARRLLIGASTAVPPQSESPIVSDILTMAYSQNG